MAVKGARVFVATTATQLNTVPTDTVSGASILVRNRGGASIFLGAEDVTVETGYELEADEYFTVDINEDVFGVCASGSVLCHVFEAGL
jgi:uncharacterized protein YciU (UPF0263 family)